jgi:DNA-binding XRE family transcriptional regulator
LSANGKALSGHEAFVLPPDCVWADDVIANAVAEFGGHAAFTLSTRRARWDLTQKDVAQKAGLSVYRLRQLEHAKRLPTLSEATRLAAVLDCPVRDFFDR